MGSQAIQSKLWGQRVKHWASIQEPTGKAGYDFVLQNITLNPSTALLDTGCGSGYFAEMAYNRGAVITGIDATPELITAAKIRVSQADFVIGEMEELPFDDNIFDVVCGFNSFQYAAQTANAIAEAKRVLKPGGKLAAMIWGDKEECEAASYLKAVGSLMPLPPPGAPGPFALSENYVLEKILKQANFKIISNNDITSIWDYPDADTAVNGLISAGPVARAIDNSGFEKVYSAISQAIKPYQQPNGHVVYRNKFRVVIAEK